MPAKTLSQVLENLGYTIARVLKLCNFVELRVLDVLFLTKIARARSPRGKKLRSVWWGMAAPKDSPGAAFLID